mgnify:CR=1 FL=1
MSISDSLYEPEPVGVGPEEGSMPPQYVDCFHHGRAPSIDPRTGRPPVYRKERFVQSEVHFNKAVVDPDTNEVRAVPTTEVVNQRVPYGPELPAGGGVCKLCWMQRGNTPSAPAPKPEPSALAAVADMLGITVDELRKKLMSELLKDTTS